MSSGLRPAISKSYSTLTITGSRPVVVDIESTWGLGCVLISNRLQGRVSVPERCVYLSSVFVCRP